MLAIELIEAVDLRPLHLEHPQFRFRQPYLPAVGRRRGGGCRRGLRQLRHLELATAIHHFVPPLGLLLIGRRASRHDLADSAPDGGPVGGVRLHDPDAGLGGKHAYADV